MGLLDKLFGGGKKDSGPTLTYKVGVSDTCRSVAKKFYGDESQWEKVYKPLNMRPPAQYLSGRAPCFSEALANGSVGPSILVAVCERLGA